MIGRPKSSPKKVKVISGGSASQARTPVDKEPELTILETEERRDHGHYIISQRLADIDIQYKDMSHKLYLPYLKQ